MMAKPPGWPTDAVAAHSNSRSQRISHPQLSSNRRRTRRSPFGAIAGPSSGVLSLLATITAASSTADGSPLVAQPTPPSFLCPSIERDVYEDDVNLFSESIAESSGAVLLAPTETKKHRRRRELADKYEKGPDGKWRQADGYTLYGSTMCKNCEPTGTSGVNDAIGPSAPTTLPSTSSTSTTSTLSHDRFNANMPTGWQSPTSVDSWRTTVILSVSLVLSVIICGFIAGFLICRRKRRRALIDGEEEIKLQRRRGDDLSELEDLMEQEARAKQKFWVRHSARWKANIRSSARRRRNRRLMAGAQAAASSAISVREATVAMSRSTSISSLRPSSTHSLSSNRTSIHDDQADDAPPLPTGPPPAAEAGPSSPPAYIQRHTPISTEPKQHSSNDSTEPFPPPPSHEHIDIDEYLPLSDDERPPIPYGEHADHAYHGGHVATDDKALLARIAEMASAPEEMEDGPSRMETSAPDWHDDELEIAMNASFREETVPRMPSPSPAFPAPPSKGKMAAPNFYNYPYSFEADLDSVEPESGPSAPPFEEHAHAPSAPPLDDADLEASAPPLSDDLAPSAPALYDGENLGQDHDRERSASPSPDPHRHSLSSISPLVILPSYRA